MTASEMTNERIADVIEQTYCASSSPFGETMREAAARLRLLDNVTMALNIEVGMNNVAAKITASMRAKLKVAEDALEESLNYSNSEELRKAQHKAKNALAAIRGKGGAK